MKNPLHHTIPYGVLLILTLAQLQAATLRLVAPSDYQVIQREHRDQATLIVEGHLVHTEIQGVALEARIVTPESTGDWQPLSATFTSEQFSASMQVPAGGWHRLELRAVTGDRILTEAAVDHLGVGEVFVVAGQSNAANHGEERQSSTSGKVVTFDGMHWRICADPQPGASGAGGSFLPPFGDAMAQRFEVPVGFVACGIGATSVREWLPKGTKFPNPPTLTGRVRQHADGTWESNGEAFETLVSRLRQLGPRGFRAVLWHQGESDANQQDPTRTLSGSLYREYLGKLIHESQHALAWNAPWFVAQVSYHVPGDEASPDIRAAQASLWRDGIALPGPDSDALKGDLRENQGMGVHFSGPGLRAHAAAWVECVAPWLEQRLEATPAKATGTKDPTPAVQRSSWQGFERADFSLDGRKAWIVQPHSPAPGKPWIWRTEFFGHEPQVDLALLNRGFHVAYLDLQNLYGAPVALDAMDQFHAHLTHTYELSTQVVLEGFSRGGLFALNWAARRPELTACLYLDAPVCDFKSWPAGWGASPGSLADWERCKQVYGLDDEQARRYPLNPVDNLAPLARAGIPILSVCGDADTVVPFSENTALLYERYRALGGPITVLVKPGVDHHPHSLKQPRRIVDFILTALNPQPMAPDALRGLERLPESEESREARLQWFRQAKLGLFVHWGPASVSGEEISWGMQDRIEGGPELQRVPRATYMNLYRRFNPVKFDPETWLQLAHAAGMRYVVFVAKHHDGFSLWPTRQERFPPSSEFPPHYSIADSPYQKDICSQIQVAAQKLGLRLGWYYSTRDWTHPDYLQGDNLAYNAYYEAQIHELLGDYGPVDLLWFDHCFGQWNQYSLPALFDQIYARNPRILINNRAARGLADIPKHLQDRMDGDFDTPENRMGGFQYGRAWESCMILSPAADGGGWSYRPTGKTRTLGETIQLLSSAACGDGNMLLNIAPLPDGTLRPEEVAILDGLAPWTRRYGEAIYNTRGGPWTNGSWGGSTHRDRTIYLHLLPQTKNTLTLNPISESILTAEPLTGGTVELSQTPQGVTLNLSATTPDPFVTLIKLTLDRPAAGPRD